MNYNDLINYTDEAKYSRGLVMDLPVIMHLNAVSSIRRSLWFSFFFTQETFTAFDFF